MKHIIYTVLIIVTPFTLWFCSDNNVISPPSEFRFDESHGVLRTDTLYTIDERFIVKDPLETGNASTLSLGRTPDFEAFFLIKFVELPADSLLLDSVYVELNGFGKLDLADRVQMDLEVYEMSETWNTSANTEEMWQNYMPASAPLHVQSINLDDSLSYKIPIDVSLIDKWQDDEQNFGLLFRAQDMENQVVKEFASFNSFTSPPGLIYTARLDTSLLRDTLRTGTDVTVFRYTGTVYEDAASEGDIIVSSGVPSRAYFKFDYSSIPKSSLISRARFELDFDTDNPYNNPNHSNSFYLRSVIESESGLEVDSLLSYDINVNYILAEDEGEFTLTQNSETLFGQNYIQALINGDLNQDWFSVQYVGESASLSLMKFFGSENPTEQRPKLIIQYLYAE